MFDFHEKRKIRGVLYSKPVIGLILAVTLLLSYSVYGRYTVASDMKDKLEAKKASLEELKGRASVLDSKVEYLENERGIEEELRNRFDVAREGEQVIILLDADRAEKKPPVLVPSTPQNDRETKKSFSDFFNF
jgi:cell division protein FtsB